MSTSAPHFFISYSRDDANQQRRIIAELRARGINVWVDIENLIPGSPAWEREIERAIRGASGIIVLLSPDSNNSEWVRREISFAEQNAKRIFPVLIFGDEDNSIPLRLSNHQRVDVRRNFKRGMDELADALRDHLGMTAVSKRPQRKATTPIKITRADLKKLALPGLFTVFGLACIGGLVLTARFIFSSINNSAIPTITIPPDIDPAFTPTNINTNEGITGVIVYTCQVNKVNTSDQICVINADGSGQRQLTDSNSGDNQDASFAPDGKSILFVSNRTGNYEIYEVDLSGNTTQLTNLGSRLGLPEVSPDNQWIVFSNRVNGDDQIWLIDRHGKNAQMLFQAEGQTAVAPTWSPNGDEILFAVGKDLTRQLFIMGSNGREPRLLSDKIITPGRTDWSNQGLIAYFTGEIWKREVWTIYPDGTGMTQVTNGGNAQSPSFSPGGRYITFTAYTKAQQQDELSCEIFVMDLYSGDQWQLTENDYCDYQPRWGP